MEFTKRKWEVLEGDYRNELIVVDSNGEDIVDTYNVDYKKRSHEECKANAHLIASAPDMFEWIEAMTGNSTKRETYLNKKHWGARGNGLWFHEELRGKDRTLQQAMKTEGVLILKRARGES